MFTLKEILKGIIGKEDLKSKFLSLHSEKDIYSFVKENGYDGSEETFGKELVEIVEEYMSKNVISENDLSKVGGGIKGNKATAAALAILSAFQPLTSAANLHPNVAENKVSYAQWIKNNKVPLGIAAAIATVAAGIGVAGITTAGIIIGVKLAGDVHRQNKKIFANLNKLDVKDAKFNEKLTQEANKCVQVIDKLMTEYNKKAGATINDQDEQAKNDKQFAINAVAAYTQLKTAIKDIKSADNENEKQENKSLLEKLVAISDILLAKPEDIKENKEASAIQKALLGYDDDHKPTEAKIDSGTFEGAVKVASTEGFIKGYAKKAFQVDVA